CPVRVSERPERVPLRGWEVRRVEQDVAEEDLQNDEASFQTAEYREQAEEALDARAVRIRESQRDEIENVGPPAQHTADRDQTDSVGEWGRGDRDGPGEKQRDPRAGPRGSLPLAAKRGEEEYEARGKADECLLRHQKGIAQPRDDRDDDEDQACVHQRR